MKTIKLYCKKCNIALTNDLEEISNAEVNWVEDDNSIPYNRYIDSKDNQREVVLVAIDAYLLKDNSNNNDYGCCGNSNHESFNKTCLNGHEVATEINDCWSGFYIAFDKNKIVVKEINKDFKPTQNNCAV